MYTVVEWVFQCQCMASGAISVVDRHHHQWYKLEYPHHQVALELNNVEFHLYTSELEKTLYSVMDATWPSYIYALKAILSIHNSLKNDRMPAFPIEIVVMTLSWCKNRKVAPINSTNTLGLSAVLLENMRDALQQTIWCTLALTIQQFIHRLHARCDTLTLLIFLRDEYVDAQHGEMGQYEIKNDMTCINRLWLLYICMLSLWFDGFDRSEFHQND